MDPAALERRHRLELEHLARLLDPLGRTRGEVDQLALAAAAIVLDVDEHARPLAGAPGEHQVDEVLERGQALALAPDQRPQGLAIGAVADDVQPAGLAFADLDRDALEAEVTHERLEDVLARRPASRASPRRPRAPRAPWRASRERSPPGRPRPATAPTHRGRRRGVGPRTVVAARAAVGATVAAIATAVIAAGGAGSGGRPVVPAGPAIRAAVGAAVAATVVAPGAAVGTPVGGAVAIVGPVLAGRLRGQRGRLGRLALGGGTAEGAPGRGHDPGRLRAHAQDAAAAGGEDLEVEVREPDAERVAGGLDRLFDGLAGELLVLAHVSVVSLVARFGFGWAGSSSGRTGPDRRPSSAPRCSWAGRVRAAWAGGS